MLQIDPDETAAVAANRQMADGCLARHARAYRPGPPPATVAAGLRERLGRVVRARTAATYRGTSGSPPSIGE